MNNKQFIGRKQELQLLKSRLELNIASLIVCKGRRRVGKSRLIKEFSANFRHYYEFQGLAPDPKDKKKVDQLKVFSEQFAAQFALPGNLKFANWTEAFATLASQCEDKQSVLIFLDEISWLASSDSTFAGKLKIAWDTQFKKNSGLILVLCGSVSSWIDENIINNTGYVGRVSLTLNLKELPLKDCQSFWGKQALKVSVQDKAKVLAVTGGVPRYLEEINPKLSAEENINRLCFTSEGLLFFEFDHIFNQQFNERADTYRAILKTLINRRLSLSEIAKSLNKTNSGYLSSCLADLESSGFISQNQLFYRISDNYTRFYLNYIFPNKDKIKAGLYKYHSLENLPEWPVIMGFQFENLILNNLPEVLKNLEIPFESILSAGSFVQKATKLKKACQIDLLIDTKYNVYICEIKFKKKITKAAIDEVEEKIKKLNLPANKSIRPVLIYEGELDSQILREDYFSSILSFKEIISNDQIF